MIRMVCYFFVLSVSVLPFSGLAQAETIVSEGNIDNNTTWTQSGSPYILEGSVTIAKDSNLTVEPGVTVQSDGHYSISVHGSLTAEGTVQEPIVFTSSSAEPQARQGC